MTIASILKKHGYNAQRGVSPTGKLIFGSEALRASASALTVKPHTFHGGANPVDEIPVPGYDISRDSTLIVRDRLEMAKFFPSFAEETKVDGPSVWFGTIDTGRGSFPIRIEPRSGRALPRVIPVGLTRRSRTRGGRTVKSPHLYLNGDLCVAGQDDWDPSTDSVATVVAWAAHWHAAYVEWFSTDNWPMEGYEIPSA
jgi:hypothetical protein